MIKLPYGWRGKLGLVYIASAWSMEAEYADMAPLGVTTHTTRIALSDNPDCFGVNDVSNLGDKVVEATKLLAQAPLNSIAFGCTSGSFTNGIEYDQKLIEEMEEASNGIRCTTTSNSVVKALQSYKVQKIAIATPYSEEMNTLAKKFFQDNGFIITNMTGLGLTSDYDISNTSIETVYQMARQADTKDAEALFISCTGLSTVHMIQTLEEDLGKPVISSNQATFWNSLRLAGIQTKMNGFGSLLAK